MVAVDSVALRRLTAINHQASKNAPNTGSSATNGISVNPGRRIIRTPMKPITVAAQRVNSTLSFNSSAAMMVVNNGAVKLSAVASANGIWDSAMKNAAVMITVSTAVAK